MVSQKLCKEKPGSPLDPEVTQATWSPLLAGLGEVKAVRPGQPPLFPMWLVSLQGGGREKPPSLAFLSEGFRQQSWFHLCSPSFLTWEIQNLSWQPELCVRCWGRAREEGNLDRPGRPGYWARCFPDFYLCSLPSLI